MTVEVSLEFAQKSALGGLEPVVLFTLDTAQGRYVLSDAPLDDQTAGMLGPVLADGRLLADGRGQAGEGSYQVLAVAPIVERFGSIRESLSPKGGDLLAGLQQDEVGSLSLRLVEQGGLVADMEASGGLLGALGRITVGYPGLKPREFMGRFAGRVQGYQMDRNRMVLKLRAV